MQPLALTGTYATIAAIIFGALLGFILIRSELAWRKTFIDQFSMKNSQLFKTLFFSMAVGVMLFYALKLAGVVHLNIRANFFWGSALGGMICAAGAVFCGQVPSTAVASMGAGRIYAIWVFAGMMIALPFVQLISKFMTQTIYQWPKPANYAERLDQCFTGSNVFLTFSVVSLVLCLFFGFIQSGKSGGGKGGGKKGDSE